MARNAMAAPRPRLRMQHAVNDLADHVSQAALQCRHRSRSARTEVPISCSPCPSGQGPSAVPFSIEHRADAFKRTFFVEFLLPTISARHMPRDIDQQQSPGAGSSKPLFSEMDKPLWPSTNARSTSVPPVSCTKGGTPRM